MKMNPMIMLFEKNLEIVSVSNIFYTFPPKKRKPAHKKKNILV